MNKEIEKKIKIAQTATRRYVENNRFTIQSLADDLNISSSEIFNLFPNRSSILRYYYESMLIIYNDQAKKIDGYKEFTLGEKLNNLFQSITDQFQDDREFVLLTYRKMIVESCSSTAFRDEFIKALKSIFYSDTHIPASSKPFINGILFSTLFMQFHCLILFWKYDESHAYENTMALTDKWCSLIEELYYSKTIDKGLDFAKFLVTNSPLKSYISDRRGVI